MHILDLPMDILACIFDHFHLGIGRILFIKTTQSVRLVCSVFSRFASALLYPTVTVQLDRIYLDHIDEISSIPFISAGIRHINVSLQYRPKELADDLLRYKNQRVKELDKLLDEYIYAAELYFVFGYAENPEEARDEDQRVYDKAMTEFTAITSAWDSCFHEIDVAMMDADKLRYRKSFGIPTQNIGESTRNSIG
ncbi:hypothetical protein V491_01363 [Pseudogymnoascus sp. VKM F-3775]|nr:hypothetical protein V491_01363 [Pseudogymnoascus sp. VKM F-3775]